MKSKLLCSSYPSLDAQQFAYRQPIMAFSAPRPPLPGSVGRVQDQQTSQIANEILRSLAAD